MTLGAESTSLAVDFVGASACGAVGCVAGKSLHDVELVVAREAGVGGDGSEVDLADEGRHRWLLAYWLFENLFMQFRLDVVESRSVERRHLERVTSDWFIGEEKDSTVVKRIEEQYNEASTMRSPTTEQQKSDVDQEGTGDGKVSRNRGVVGQPERSASV